MPHRGETPPPPGASVPERAHRWASQVLRDSLDGPARPLDPAIVAYIDMLADRHRATARKAARMFGHGQCDSDGCGRVTNRRLSYCCEWCKFGHGTHTDTCDERQP